MTHVVLHPQPEQLPSATSDCIPVQLYGQDGRTHRPISAIGNPLFDPIQRLGIKLPTEVFDFLTLALAVTAADTFVLRKRAADCWTREIHLVVPLVVPETWQPLQKKLQDILHFLSGDIWKIEFTEGGMVAPRPYSRRQRYRMAKIRRLDSVCLFSGGLDSAIGAADLLYTERKPLLVSHAYPGDKSYQSTVSAQLKGVFTPFGLNAHPVSHTGDREITMRTRSFNFLAFGVIGAYAIAAANNIQQVDLFVPENGLISLNPPLTPRRVGSLSTRTTHPYFLDTMQSIFDAVHIPVKIVNPYQFKTKGEMLSECLSQETLNSILPLTVSCSNWKRKRMQCGRCVPCLIRRAAIFSTSRGDDTPYQNPDLQRVFRADTNRDDLFAIASAVNRLSPELVNQWIMNSGPLPTDEETRAMFKDVFVRGMQEVKLYLKHEGIL